MSLNFTKLPYVDGETVIPARNLNEIQDAILDLDDNKVEKEPGKGLSTNDYSDTDKSKVDTALQATTSTTLGPSPIVTFDASAADMPLKGLTVNIEPVQSGSGDPSPDNVRPITGWTGAKVTRTGKNLLKLDESKMVSDGWDRIFPVSLKAGTYILSCQNQFGASVKGAKVNLTDENDSTVIVVLAAGYTFGDTTFIGATANITEEQADKIKNIQFALRAGGTTYNDIVQGNIQLELGSTATAYEPYQGTTYDITFPTEAGTVYGGTLDVTNKKLTVEYIKKTLTGTEDWASLALSETYNYFRLTLGNYGSFVEHSAVSSHWPHVEISSTTTAIGIDVIYSTKNQITAIVIRPGIDSVGTDAVNFKTYLSEQYANGTPVEVLYEPISPIVYDLTDIPEITTLHGTNNIWADTGDVTVIYGEYLGTIKAHADRLGDSILSAIAPLEASYTASRTYAVGSYLFVGTKFYKVTQAIAEGGTITPGTNAVQTTVAEQLMTLAVKPAILG